MIFTKLLDDSNPSKIRTSIYIVAALLMFITVYQIEIPLPAFIQSAIESKKIDINHNDYLWFLCVIQGYLLVRIMLAFKVSHAIFESTWVIDQFGPDLKQLKEELRVFNEHAERQVFNVDEFKIALSKEADGYRRLSKALEKLASVDFHKWPAPNEMVELLKNSNADPATAKALQVLAELADDFNYATHLIPGDLAKIAKQTQEDSGETREFVDQFNKFQQAFPKSNYTAAIEVNESGLIQSKKYKSLEMWVFDLMVPLGVGLFSLIFRWYY